MTGETFDDVLEGAIALQEQGYLALALHPAFEGRLISPDEATPFVRRRWKDEAMDVLAAAEDNQRGAG
jgi:hypothetical protein